MALLLLAGQSGMAQTSKAESPQVIAPPSVGALKQARIKLNQETLVIAAGRPGTSYMAMASDLAAAADTGGSLRLLPMATDGGLANLQDLLFLRRIDLAIVSTNVLAHAKTTRAFGSALRKRVAYVTALYGEGVHIVAGRGISTVGDLGGKKVAVPAGDDTVHFTASDVFKRLGIAVESVPMEPAAALDEVRRGAIAAVLLVGGKPLPEVSDLPKDGSLRLLTLPFQTLSGEGYAPAVFLPEDYPALIPPGAMVETVAVGAVLMANNSSDDAAQRIAKHTPALLDAIGTLAVSHTHPGWKDVNLGAVLPGWSRVAAAEKWLRQAVAQRKQQLKGASEPPRAAKPAAPKPVAPKPVAAKPVKASSASAPHQRKKLFDEFEAWTRQSAAAQSAPQ